MDDVTVSNALRFAHHRLATPSIAIPEENTENWFGLFENTFCTFLLSRICCSVTKEPSEHHYGASEFQHRGSLAMLRVRLWPNYDDKGINVPCSYPKLGWKHFSKASNENRKASTRSEGLTIKAFVLSHILENKLATHRYSPVTR